MNTDWVTTMIERRVIAQADKWQMARYISYQVIMHPAPWRLVRQVLVLKYDRD